MRMTVRFGYDATVSTASRETAHRSYVEDMHIDLLDVPSSIAREVVKSARSGIGDNPLSRYRHGDAGRIETPLYDAEVREIDGILYSPVTRSTYDYGGMGWRHERVTGARMLAEGLDKIFPKFPSLAAAIDVKRKGPPNAETVKYGYRDQATEAMDRLIKSLVLVDGELYHSCLEPVYIARTGQVDFVFDPSYEDLVHAFRLDELDLAISRAALLAKVSEFDVTVPAVQVVDQAFIKRVPDDMAIIVAAKTLDAHVAMNILSSLPMSAMMAFCDLREALRDDERKGDTVVLKDFVESLCIELEAAGHAYGLPETRDVLRVSDARRQLDLELAPEFGP